MKYSPVTTTSSNRPETWDEFVSTEPANNTANRNEGNILVLDPLEPTKGQSKTSVQVNNNAINNNNSQGIPKMPMTTFKR